MLGEGAGHGRGNSPGHVLGEPTQADFDRAAMAVVSVLARLDAEADKRGEESQDMGEWS